MTSLLLPQVAHIKEYALRTIYWQNKNCKLFAYLVTQRHERYLLKIHTKLAGYLIVGARSEVTWAVVGGQGDSSQNQVILTYLALAN